MKAESEFYTRGEVRLVGYECPDCNLVNSCAVLPHNPVISKHRCEHCGRLNEVKTRDSFEEEIAEHIAEVKDIREFRRRAPSSEAVMSNELRAVREARERALGQRTVVDPRSLGLPGWGNATLI